MPFAGRVEGIDGAVAFADDVLHIAVHRQLDDRFSHRFAILILHVDAVMIELEGRLKRAGLLHHQQIKRRFGGFKLVAFVFQILNRGENLLPAVRCLLPDGTWSSWP